MSDQEAMLAVMRDALGQIARNRKDGGKPAATRRDMQQIARRALIDCGYPSWAENVTSKAAPHDPL